MRKQSSTRRVFCTSLFFSPPIFLSLAARSRIKSAGITRCNSKEMASFQRRGKKTSRPGRVDGRAAAGCCALPSNRWRDRRSHACVCAALRNLAPRPEVKGRTLCLHPALAGRFARRHPASTGAPSTPPKKKRFSRRTRGRPIP